MLHPGVETSPEMQCLLSRHKACHANMHMCAIWRSCTTEHPNFRRLDHAGLYDSRVSFWEPAKWVAKTRQLTTGRPVILLLTQMAAGHAGVSGVFSQLRETALQQAFLLRATCAAAQPLTQVK